MRARTMRHLLLPTICSLLACKTERVPAAPTSAAAHAVVRDSVLARMQRYVETARRVDTLGADFFAPRGTLFEPGIPPIVSPDSIRRFIASFPGVVVDSAMLRADTVEVFDGTALVWGTYYEALHFPGQPSSRQYGRFVMEWQRDSNATWLIERYYRVPLPPTWVDTPR